MRHALAIRLSLVAVIGFPVPAALAQQPQGEFPEFSTYDLFEPDGTTPIPEVVTQLADTIRAAQAPDGCPLGRLKLRTPAGDPLFQDALAAARRNAVLAALHRLVPVAGRLFVESTVWGDESGHDAVYESARDAQPPRLNTTSLPARGRRVNAREEIGVTMVARDDAEPTHWQTGIKTIQLVAESEGGRFVASENYGPCAEAGERRVEAIYIVPENPPPVVRLSALAEDHAGLMDTDAAEFPTGDWTGRVEWLERYVNDASPDSTGGEHTHSGYADFSLSDDGEGNLTGDLIGSQRGEYWYGYRGEAGCTATIPPTPISARVTGSYTPGTGAMSVQFIDLDAKVTQSLRGTYGESHDTLGRCDVDTLMDFGIYFAGLARSLQPVGDGTYRAGWQADASGGLAEHRWSMTLRRTAE